MGVHDFVPMLLVPTLHISLIAPICDSILCLPARPLPGTLASSTTAAPASKRKPGRDGGSSRRKVPLDLSWDKVKGLPHQVVGMGGMHLCFAKVLVPGVIPPPTTRVTRRHVCNTSLYHPSG